MIIYLEDKTDKISDTELSLMAKACEIQYQRDFAPSRNLNPNDFKIKVEKPFSYDVKATISDKPSDVDGAEAYHYVDEKGFPLIEVFTETILANGGKNLKGPNSVSIAFSHEILEYLSDPYTNRWVDTGGHLLDKVGKSWKEVCEEVCDPVEDSFYVINVDGTSVDVSNFVLPAWMNPSDQDEKRDFMGMIDFKTPFGMTEGGYLIVRDRPGHELDIYASKFPDWKLSKKRNFGSRSYRRRHGAKNAI